MPKVSIIVPVYNVYNYLEKCLDSLVNQTLKDIEIIVVNDGSPDNSQEIIDKYQKKYKQIKAYIKENGGLSSARNFGIEKATGDYIAFVDSDDYVFYDMYEIMYKKAISNNFDMVVCNLNYVYDNEVLKAYSNIKTDTTNIKEILLNIYPSAWNKLFHKRLFDTKIEFKKDVWFEDFEFIYRILPYIKTIGVVNNHLYQYVQREGTITKTASKKIYDYIDNCNSIIDFYIKHQIYNNYKLELEYVYVRYIYATFIKQATKFDKLEFNNAVEKAIKSVNDKFPNYRKNKYFYKNLKGIYLLFFNKFLAKLIYNRYNKCR